MAKFRTNLVTLLNSLINGACHSVKIALKVSVARLGDILDFGQLFKASGKINLPQSSPFLGNFCKGVKIIHFSSDTIFGQLLYTINDFYLVTLPEIDGCQFENIPIFCSDLRRPIPLQ